LAAVRDRFIGLLPQSGFASWWNVAQMRAIGYHDT
jgi:hypothetical protein